MEHNDDKFTHNEIFKKFQERSRNWKENENLLVTLFWLFKT